MKLSHQAIIYTAAIVFIYIVDQAFKLGTATLLGGA